MDRTRARRLPDREEFVVSMLRPHAVATVHETAGGVVVDLPSPRRPVTVLLLALWLAVWVVGLGFVSQQFVQGDGTRPDWAFLIVWALLWLAAGAASAIRLSWLVAGAERITLDEVALRIRRGAWGFEFTRTYPVADVHDMRTFGREIPLVLAVALDLAGSGSTGVRFRCGDRVVRCARALDEKAAHALVGVLLAHRNFPGSHGRPQVPAA
jgi:hypothetical protein